jgi:hypothetical protein
MRLCFPDRARELSAALEDWLEPGPWSLDFKPAEKGALDFSAGSRDRLRVEVRRALRETGPERVDELVQDLDRWLVRSFAVSLCARIGQRSLASKSDYESGIHEWKKQALALQIHTPSLSSARSELELSDMATRIAADLGAETSRKQIRLAGQRALARDVVHGRIERGLAAARFSALGADVADHVRLSQLPSDQLPVATLHLAQRILGRAARMQLPETK